MKKKLILLFLAMFIVNAWAQEKIITIDASKKMHQASTKLNGTNIEDLNFQCYGGVYSQLLYGQDFEEQIDIDFLNLPTQINVIGKNIIEAEMSGPQRYTSYIVLDEKSRPYLTKSASGGAMNPMGYPVTKTYEIESKSITRGGGFLPIPSGVIPVDSLPADQRKMILARVNGDDQISRFWRKVSSGDASGVYKLITDGQYRGRRDQLMKFVSGKGEVGLDNMGVIRMGINFQKGKNYEGVLRVKNPKAGKLYVAILNSDATQKLAEKAISLKASPDAYQKVEFELTPSKSDTKGRFAVILKEPGEVTLGYAFLQPGTWGRVKGGFPIRQDFVDQMKANGIGFIRYNGGMNGGPDAKMITWKNMIGPRDERLPYTGSFIPYATFGFGFFESMMLAEAAGIDEVLGITLNEDPAGIKDMLEYTNGSLTSKWGARRAQDGHPDPYNLKYIEIANEQSSVGSGAYFEKFKVLATEIWKADSDMSILLSINIFVAMPPPEPGVTESSTDKFIRNFVNSQSFLSSVVAGQQNNADYNRLKEFLLWIKTQGKEEKFAWDSHYHGGIESEEDTYKRIGLYLAAALAKDINFKLRLLPLEENGPNHSYDRGLAHALLQNRLNRWGNRVEAAATANMFQPENAYTAFSQGRVFYDSYRFWNQTSGHVDRMFTKEWLPWVLDIKEQAPVDSLDVLVKISDDNKVMGMYVVNYGMQPQTRNLEFSEFTPADQATVTQLGPYPFLARNSGEDPKLISPVVKEKKIGNKGFEHQFPGHSFTLIRVNAKEHIHYARIFIKILQLKN